MELNICKEKNYLIIKIVGRLDISNTAQFKSEVSESIEDAKIVILELSELEFMDSTGLGSIISILKIISKNGGNIFVANLQEKPRILFEITRANRIFDIYNSLEDAINAVENYQEE